MPVPKPKARINRNQITAKQKPPTQFDRSMAIAFSDKLEDWMPKVTKHVKPLF